MKRSERQLWKCWSDVLYSFGEDPKQLKEYISRYPVEEQPLAALALSVAKWMDFDRLMNIQHDTNTCACCQFYNRSCKKCFMVSCGEGSLYEAYCDSFFEFFEGWKQPKQAAKKICNFLYDRYVQECNKKRLTA